MLGIFVRFSEKSMVCLRTGRVDVRKHGVFGGSAWGVRRDNRELGLMLP